MSNYERFVVGAFVVPEIATTTQHYECAAWHRTFRVEPGTYEVVAMIGGASWSEGSLGSSLYVEIPSAEITSACLIALFGGVAIRGKDGKTFDEGPSMVGTRDSTSIKLPTYCLHDYVLDGRLTLDESLVSAHDHAFPEGYVRRYYRWREGYEYVMSRIRSRISTPTTEVAL